MIQDAEGVHRYTLGEDGCEISPSCLTCPMVACRYDYEGEGKLSLAHALEDTFRAGIINLRLINAWGRMSNVSWSSLSRDAREGIGLSIAPLAGESARDHLIRLYRFGLSLNEAEKLAGVSHYFAKQYTEGVKRAEQWAA